MKDEGRRVMDDGRGLRVEGRWKMDDGILLVNS
jgi:hypothetical protein